MALISVSSHPIYIYIYILCMLRISESGNRVRTCGPDMSSKNASKMQINIKICDCFIHPKKWEEHQIFCPPTAKGGGGHVPPPPPPPLLHDAHVYNC